MIYSLFNVLPLLSCLVCILWLICSKEVHTRRYLFVKLSSPISSAAGLKHQ